MLRKFECVKCSSELVTDQLDGRCLNCGSRVLLENPPAGAPGKRELERLPPGVWRYRGFLPEVSSQSIVSLGEGGTPLLKANRLGAHLGLNDLMVKDETRNPTGSFIDRGLTVLVSLAAEAGVRRFSCMTTGNLGASLAAYSARAGIEAAIRIHQNTDLGKLYQMIAYGAAVEVVSGDQRGSVRSVAFDVSPVNPFILEGEKTTAFEVFHDLGWQQPDVIILPVGTGGHLAMAWRSILQLQEAGLLGVPKCRLLGVQVEAPRPAGEGDPRLTELEEPEPSLRAVAVASMKMSGGKSIEVTAKEAVSATSLLARTEGIFAEPAAASVVASLKIAKEAGLLDANDKVVCIVTGAGLKDTKTIRKPPALSRRLAPSEETTVRPLQLGPTKLRLMRELRSKSSFGYDLWKALCRDGKITTASIYQHLSELEDAAVVRRSQVTRVGGRERVFYELTGRGREFLKAFDV
jgi:threonine synthase